MVRLISEPPRSLIEVITDRIKKASGFSTSTSTETTCIFKIPEIPRPQNEKAYDPIAFSIGLWNKQIERIEKNEHLKNVYTHDLIYRAENPEEFSNELVKLIWNNIILSCHCYPKLNYLRYGYRDVAATLLIDSCFIIEFIHKLAFRNRRHPEDPIFGYMLQFVFHDLTLLENQIPWFLIESVFDKCCNLQILGETVPFIEYFSGFLRMAWPAVSWNELCKENKFTTQQRPKHILDLLRLGLVYPLEDSSLDYNNQVNMGWKPIPPVTILRSAGIKIKRNSFKTSILQIEFKNGVLKIPALEFREGTEHIFRNLIFYEQSMPKYSNHVTSYVIFMGCLINTVNDFELLCEAGVLDNWMNGEDVVRFFNNPLYPGAHVKDYCYNNLSEEVNEYCKRRWPRLLAIYRNEFTTSWAIISQVVAAFLFIFTLLQTVFSIIKK